jgi:hypothetical protein
MVEEVVKAVVEVVEAEVVEVQRSTKKMFSVTNVTNLAIFNLNAQAGRKIMPIMLSLVKKKRSCLWHKKPKKVKKTVQSMRFGSWIEVAATT